MGDRQNKTHYVPSRFLSLSHDDDGSLILYCARTGAVGVVAQEDAESARKALLRDTVTEGPLSGILSDLEQGGFLVLQGTDESAIVHENYIRRYTDRSLELIIMPTEQCNFRCVYCYEAFLRGEMTPDIRNGVKKFVESQQGLEQLTVSWFGGEPLIAGDVVAEITEHCQQYAAHVGAAFQCAATTNGYELTPEYADRIIPLGLKNFQISLDGVEHDHDERRVGANGEKTFARIMENLRYLHSSDHDFEVAIRYNFDPGNIPRVADFYEMLKSEFGGDERFVTELQPIGRWGGENDASLSVCEGRPMLRSLIEAKKLALDAGFRDAHGIDMLRPSGAICYAANPRSFVIGSDGKVYKCTVELDYHDRNIVGQLHSDGTMDLDWRKMALWTETNGMDTGKKCVSCYFSPTCHCAICPKEWMDEGEAECPKSKHTIGDTLKLIRAESLFIKPSATA